MIKKEPVVFAMEWIALTVIGEMIGELIDLTPIVAYICSWLDVPHTNTVLGAILSMAMSAIRSMMPPLFQWLLLRHRIKRAWLWIPVSIFGEWLGLVAGLPFLPPRGQYHGFLLPADWAPLVREWAAHEFFLQTCLSTGLLVGLGQYFLLRRVARYGSWWIVASMGGYTVGCICSSFLLQSLFPYVASSYWKACALAIATEAVAGCGRGVVTVFPLVSWFYGTSTDREP